MGGNYDIADDSFAKAGSVGLEAADKLGWEDRRLAAKAFIAIDRFDDALDLFRAASIGRDCISMLAVEGAQDDVLPASGYSSQAPAAAKSSTPIRHPHRSHSIDATYAY